MPSYLADKNEMRNKETKSTFQYTNKQPLLCLIHHIAI